MPYADVNVMEPGGGGAIGRQRNRVGVNASS
jgi:hypothetical protein